jgi:hypothetical protein
MIRALLHWLREEWRLMWLETWAEEPRSTLGTMADPKVQVMVTRQRAYGKRLRRQGRSLLGGKSGKVYKPALTVQVPIKPDDGKVIPIRRKA